MGNLPCLGFPALPDSVFRNRLAAIHGRLHDLRDSAPPGCRCAVADALEALEDGLASLGLVIPQAELTAHDRAVLAALGCPA